MSTKDIATLLGAGAAGAAVGYLLGKSSATMHAPAGAVLPAGGPFDSMFLGLQNATVANPTVDQILATCPTQQDLQ